MTASAPVLPPADVALDTFELPAVGAQTGGGIAGTALKPPAEVAATRSFAAAAVREVMDVAEKAQETGRSHVELRLETKDNESLRIHLNWRDGVVHAKFVTQTPDLQRALSREWETLAPRLVERGLKFSDPSFERNGQQPEQQPGQSASSFDQQRQQPRGRSADADERQAFNLPSAAAVKSVAGTSRRSAPRAAAPLTPSSALADARGLRVWA
ncbi:MAG: flagellar hook-length control protein FliK [Opitutaceae bacterium]|nr:flagellar hook-length control protein FliK [Opitutaceae bacterium]